MNNCPMCKRPFIGIHEYPLVGIMGFSRLPLNEALGDGPFPSDDPMIYADSSADPETYGSCQRVPVFVEERFTSQKSDTVELDGWVWSRSESHPELYTRRHSDHRTVITAALEPYLRGIEGLVGQVVQSSRVLPPWENEGRSRFAAKIPDTQHWIGFGKEERMPGDCRKTTLLLLGPGSRHMTEFTELTDIATLVYDGYV